MGSRGPVPKRSSERRRTNEPEDGPITTAEAAALVVQPEPDGNWHPKASAWYVSLAASGQSVYFEPSDWAAAQVAAELLSRQLQSDRINSQIVTAWAGIATELGTTEGARRRMRIELERSDVDEDEDAADAVVTDLRARFGA